MQRTQNAALKFAARAVDAGVVAGTYLAMMELRTVLMAWWPFDLFPGAERTLQDISKQPHLEMLAVILPAWLLGLHWARTYDDLRRIRSDTLFFRILWGTLTGALISLSVLFLFQQVQYLSRSLFVGFGLAALFNMWVVRRAMLGLAKRRFEKGQDTHNILIVGTAGEALPLIKSLEANLGWGMRIVGVVHPNTEADRESSIAAYKVIGKLRDLPGLLERHPVNQVYMTGRAWDTGTLREVADTCEELGVEFAMDANFLGLRVAQAELKDFEGSTVLSFSSTPQNAEALVLKRVMDILLSAMALMASAPVMLVVAAAIKIEDPAGPVFFGQRRSGLYGRTFKMWKFRSMVTNAEAIKKQLEAQNEMDGPVFKITHDPRITRIGRFIRKTSLDEFPQFWNVLVGEMSLVGPRPPIPAEVEKYERWQMRRLSMKPGITCIWQVSGRNDIDFKTWMKLDLEYIDNWSLGLDIKLLLKTPMAVIGGTGK
jgi:exopolysaccharide biosynthesis polyprenyl glycosylphosphotransferase